MLLNEPQLETFIKAKLRDGELFTLGVCGLSGSGKTTLCKKLKNIFGDHCVHLETDWYSRYTTAVRRKRIQDAIASGDDAKIAAEENPLNRRDWSAIGGDIKILKQKRKLTIREAWDQASGNKDKTVTLALPCKGGPGLILVDGIYILDQHIRPYLNSVVLIDMSLEDSLVRMKQRDHDRSPPEYLAYKADLIRRYDVHYIEEHQASIDMTLVP